MNDSAEKQKCINVKETQIRLASPHPLKDFTILDIYTALHQDSLTIF